MPVFDGLSFGGGRLAPVARREFGSMIGKDQESLRSTATYLWMYCLNLHTLA